MIGRASYRGRSAGQNTRSSLPTSRLLSAMHAVLAAENYGNDDDETSDNSGNQDNDGNKRRKSGSDVDSARGRAVELETTTTYTLSMRSHSSRTNESFTMITIYIINYSGAQNPEIPCIYYYIRHLCVIQTTITSLWWQLVRQSENYYVIFTNCNNFREIHLLMLILYHNAVNATMISCCGLVEAGTYIPSITYLCHRN